MDFFSSFLRLTLIFTLGYSEQRFDLFQFSYPVFSIIFLRATIFSVLQVNYTFDFLSYRKHVLVQLELNWKLPALCQKKQPLVFRWKTRCFEFYSTKNIFWLVGNEIELLLALYRKNQRFCFFLATTCYTELYSTKTNVWSVCRKVVCFVCFAVVLHRKKVFFQFAASPPNFSLILLKTTFLLVFG